MYLSTVFNLQTHHIDKLGPLSSPRRCSQGISPLWAATTTPTAHPWQLKVIACKGLGRKDIFTPGTNEDFPPK